MKITSVRIKNFRGLDIEVPAFSDLTIFTGNIELAKTLFKAVKLLSQTCTHIPSAFAACSPVQDTEINLVAAIGFLNIVGEELGAKLEKNECNPKISFEVNFFSKKWGHLKYEIVFVDAMQLDFTSCSVAIKKERLILCDSSSIVLDFSFGKGFIKRYNQVVAEEIDCGFMSAIATFGQFVTKDFSLFTDVYSCIKDIAIKENFSSILEKRFLEKKPSSILLCSEVIALDLFCGTQPLSQQIQELHILCEKNAIQCFLISSSLPVLSLFSPDKIVVLRENAIDTLSDCLNFSNLAPQETLASILDKLNVFGASSLPCLDLNIENNNDF